jgi:hypothetical protein
LEFNPLLEITVDRPLLRKIFQLTKISFSRKFIMNRFSRTLFWIILSFLMLLGIDQFFLRVPLQQPALSTIRQFYLDFRTRLFHLLPDFEQTSVETVIEKEEKLPAKRNVQAPQRDKEPSYFYADDQGELRFANSLAEIPERFRKEAQRLEQ